MKLFNKILLGVLAIALLVGLNSLIPARAAATAPALRSLSLFGIVSSTSTNSNTGLQTIINGSVCGGTLTAPRPLTITGGAEETPCAPLKGTDQTAALAIINGQVCTSLGTDVALDSVAGHPTGTYTPGCYSTSGAGATSMTITTGTTVTLDGGGDPNAVFIFRAAGALKPAANTRIVLTNGASANNVFWAPIAATTIGANTTFVGNIIDAAGITIGHFSTLLGRALAFGETVTTDANTITVPTSLHLRKTVTLDDGGTALNTAWTLTATGTGGSPTNLTGTTPVDSVATFKADTYTLAESGGPSGYTAGTYSCVKNGGAPVVSNTITLASGDDATCTINNNDIASGGGSRVGTINIIKRVVNDNGRTKTIADFPLFVNGTPVASGVTNTFPAPAGAYTITETNDPNYTRAFSGDCDVNGQLNLSPGENRVCIITNDDIGAPVVVPPVPPLIDVVKVPNPLALPGGPGAVTYTYTLKNIGTVPVTSITMVGDTCSPITLISGDTNSDSRLDLSETWVYRCSTTLTATHTNTVTATGWANGISATDLASATVVVGSPIVPPLIHITKVPSPLTLGAGGGMVTYTKKVTNPGTVALNNVRVTDDKCSPINYISGDTNSDSKLDPSETWTYTCRINLIRTTTNTAIATGDANGMTARDFALATVVVANTVPALPNTGVTATQSIFTWILVAAGIFAVLLFIFIRKKAAANR